MTVEFLPTDVDSQRVPVAELWCRSKLQGIIKHYPGGRKVLEVRCKDRHCAERGAGMVVFHYFDLETGQLVDTKKYRDPRRPKVSEETMSGQTGDNESKTVEGQQK